MKVPTLRGVIDRRILVNFHADPDRVAARLPAPYRPQIVNGHAIAGICLIRLKNLRPAFLPAWAGLSSENAAHRVAVEWDESGTTRTGVYISRRDSNSRLNTLAGGRLFPGFHHAAEFTVRESDDRLEVAVQSDDGLVRTSIRGQRSSHWPAGSVFRSLEEASAFFEAGSLGYSATKDPTCFQGLELKCRQWSAEALDVEEVQSSDFDDRSLFPRGTVEFDCALLMRGIEHEWQSHPDMRSPGERRA